MSIRPSSRQLIYWATMCVAGLVVPIIQWLFSSLQITLLINTVFMAVLGLGLVIIVLDGILRKETPTFKVSRTLPKSLSVHVPQTIQLQIENLSNRAVEIEYADMLPQNWQSSTNQQRSLINANETVQIRYQATPKIRGKFAIEALQVRLTSRFGLWQTTRNVPCITSHKVYPEFTAISDLAGLNGSMNLQQSGLKTYNQRGSGSDFLHLRDYRKGDSMRQVNWRATSRLNKLISTEYQEEKNQHIIIMLDSGRRMCVQDDEMSYFDYALNAIIMLSYTALKNGDNVSLQSFGVKSRWLSQVKGARNVGQVLNHFYDLYPQKVASDYLAAAQNLVKQQPKRALVLLISCLRDEDFDDLLSATKLLKQKHLVAVVSIAEPVYKNISQKEVSSFDDALNYSASAKLETSILNNQKRLKQSGVMCINVTAQNLTPSSLNLYLSVKKSGLL